MLTNKSEMEALENVNMSNDVFDLDDFEKTFGMWVKSLNDLKNELKENWSLLDKNNASKWWGYLADSGTELVEAVLHDLCISNIALLVMMREALNSYFASLWLGVADYLNAGRAVLRSSLEAFSMGILLRNRLKESDEKVSKLASKEELEEIKRTLDSAASKIIRNRKQGHSRYSSAFVIIIRDHKKRKKRGKDEIFTTSRNGETVLQVRDSKVPIGNIWSDLSESVHERPSRIDSKMFSSNYTFVDTVFKEASKFYNGTMDEMTFGLNFNDIRSVYLSFASGELHRAVLNKFKEESRDEYNQQKFVFFRQIVHVAAIFVALLDEELKNNSDSASKENN